MNSINQSMSIFIVISAVNENDNDSPLEKISQMSRKVKVS